MGGLCLSHGYCIQGLGLTWIEASAGGLHLLYSLRGLSLVLTKGGLSV